MSIYDRLIEPPGQSFFLFGMRGVGNRSSDGIEVWPARRFAAAAAAGTLWP